MFEIKYLKDYPEHIGCVSRWLYDCFVHKAVKDLQYEKFNTFFQNNSKTELPIRLIAISGGNCIGTVTVTENDLSVRSYTPWLGGLYVDIPYRKNKIGQELIKSAKLILKELNYTEVYLATENAGLYYKKLGWQFVETCVDEFGQTVEVYKHKL